MSLEGRVLNSRYIIDKIISRGGMGDVYFGHHILIGKKVAIKVLNSQWVVRDDIVARFFQEAQAASLIGHKNIVDVLDAGLIDRYQPYLVMEYLEGQSLAKFLESTGTIDLAAACGILEPVLLALDATHKKKIIHRDLKPDNIFVAFENDRKSYTIKVIDFGISKFTNILKGFNLTMVGAAIGTPPYMSPEQARGAAEMDHRSDLFSVGVILYEMLVGALPFSGPTYDDIMAKIMTSSPTSPTTINPLFPKAAEPIINRALAKSVKERYSNAAEMLADLKKLDEYARRDVSLARYVAQITDPGCIWSEEASSRYQKQSSLSLQNALALFTPPNGDIRSILPDSFSAEKKSTLIKSRARIVSIVASVVIVVLTAVYLSVMLSKSGLPKQTSDKGEGMNAQPAATLLAEPSLPKGRETITIELRGVPKEAAMYVDNKQILSTRFTTARAKVPISLRIEAKGYTLYESALMPLKDRVVDVRLQPTAPDTDSASQSLETVAMPGDVKKPIVDGTPTKKDRARKKGDPQNYIQGRLGAEITKDFE